MARRRKKRSYVRVFLFFFVPVFLAVAAGGGVAVGILLGYIAQLPPIEELENYSPPESTFVYDSQGRTMLAEFLQKRRYVLSIRQIPDRLIKAFLAVEDRRFYEHFGVDPVGVVRAAIRNYTAGRVVEGGSTISMQLPGNILESIDRRDISYVRKLRESLIALQIERRYSKEQILEFYLNQIFLGHNSWGVEAAAKVYFGKTVQELTLGECAVLAGVPAAPSKYNPISDPEKARERRNKVLRDMLESGFINESQYRQAAQEPIVVRRESKSIAPFKAPYFVYYLQDSLLASPDFLPEILRDKVAPKDYLFTGGFRIVSTLDLGIQRIAEEVMRDGLRGAEKLWQEAKSDRRAKDPKEWGAPKEGQERLGKIVRIDEQEIEVDIEDWRGVLPRPEHPPFFDPDSILAVGQWIDLKVGPVDSSKRRFAAQLLPESKIKGAMVVLEAQTGRALAIVGGDDFYGAPEEKSEWNFATQGGRQPGSGIKPLFYAAAVANGFRPNQMFLNVPFEIGNYLGKNYNKTHEGRRMTIQEGVERSQNVMMLRVAHAVGFSKASDFVRQFDYSAPQPKWEIPQGQASSCLGTFDVTPLQLAAAYVALANEGVGIRPYAVDRIESREGKVLYETKPFVRKILTPQQAYVLISIMRGVLGPRGTAYYTVTQPWEGRKDLSLPEMAGKTGTTTRCKEAWFTGFTPDLVVCIFVGFDPPRSLGDKMTGGTVAGPIFRNFMERVLPTRSDWTMAFRAPEGIVKRQICLATGLLAGKWCNYGGSPEFSTAEMAFIQGTEPTEVCSGLHR